MKRSFVSENYERPKYLHDTLNIRYVRSVRIRAVSPFHGTPSARAVSVGPCRRRLCSRRRRKSENKREPGGTRRTLSIIVRRDARVDRSNPGVIDRAMRRAISKDAFAGCIFNYFDHGGEPIVLFPRLITVTRFHLSLSLVFFSFPSLSFPLSDFSSETCSESPRIASSDISIS